MGGQPFQLSVRRRQPCDDLGEDHVGTANGESTCLEEGPRWSFQEWKAVELGHNREGQQQRWGQPCQGKMADSASTIAESSSFPVRLVPTDPQGTTSLPLSSYQHHSVLGLQGH